jgi:hypothetical protein
VFRRFHWRYELYVYGIKYQRQRENHRFSSLTFGEVKCVITLFLLATLTRNKII